jgi:cyclic pyranopterin phosphate synthase
MSDPLTHFDEAGAARMVEVGDKRESARRARAQAVVTMGAETLARIEAGTVGKGDVLGVARLGGIQGAKQASTLIPLCHPVRITGIDVAFEVDAKRPGIVVVAEVRAVDRTGPEMEAMAAASGAALTIYDMCKAMDRGMSVGPVLLLEKSGGKSGDWKRG